MSTRIALVGAGSVARRHVGVLTSLADVDIVAIADPLRERAEELARQCDARAFTDVDDALDGTEPDAVYVCVPPFAHGPPEKAALARGRPLFVEKPLAVDLRTALDIAGHVEEAGVVTGTGYHWRCLDGVAEAQYLLGNAAPVLACGYWLDKRPTAAWWAHAEQSGGQVIEQLTHVVDLARLLLGEAVEVYAAGARQHMPTEEAIDDGDADDATAATVRFASGSVATLATTSVLDVKYKAALHVFGRGLILELSETGIVVTNKTGRYHSPAGDLRLAVDREFIQAVRGERAETRAPYDEILRSHQLACAIAESARTNQPVPVSLCQATGGVH